MNFQQLEYILAVHRHQHFGKAAESCHVTQATLSAMIIKLEEELGFSIFDRSHKPIKTTDQGLEVMEKARNILSLQRELIGIKETDSFMSGTIRIGIIPTIASSLLPIILPEIMKSYPDLKLIVNEITTEEIVHHLQMDKIDLGILATPLNEDTLEEYILYYEPMLVYGLDNSKKDYITSSEVKNKEIWLLEEGHCFRNQAITICELQEKKVDESKLRLEANSFETLINITDQFGGLTLLPELYCLQLPEQRKRKLSPFKKPIPVREISIVSYRQVVNPKTIQTLSTLIKELVTPRLSVSNYQNKDLDIIGI
ncbi:LysR substrate-binding domain-containing protein [Parvicella tangerina]|uniref:Hydrogen peroxide-inducible genes activator n=1 Tax=Parvicella tangerina TaxID=2829795 RepID=A0A916JL35_9FLAO|nr:LysR substrate-binding domain-containing protein [Parvicella tangerina]CAG5079465.1 Hydrogen peroxide-inducible genes activator [Parvicella tangerina]